MGKFKNFQGAESRIYAHQIAPVYNNFPPDFHYFPAMHFQLRTATPADLQILLDHNQAMAMETENRHLKDEVIRAGLSAVLNDPSKGFYLVAEDDGTVVGNLMITFEWSDWRNGIMWWFQSVYVKPDYRGKGVFKQMYQHIMSEAKANDVRELRLYVEKENVRAQKVYEALGMAESHYLMYEIEL